MFNDHITNLLIRIGVAFAFLYPPIDALFDPYSWLGYFPKFMHGIIPDMVLLHSFGTIEILIAFWIISGKKIFLPSAIATFILTGIILFDIQDFQIVFRDIPIAIMSAVLAIDSWQHDKLYRTSVTHI